MAVDNECDKRPDDEGTTKASTLSRFFDSESFLIITLLMLAVLNYGWVFWPILGFMSGMLQVIALVVIIMAAVFIKIFKQK